MAALAAELRITPAQLGDAFDRALERIAQDEALRRYVNGIDQRAGADGWEDELTPTVAYVREPVE